MAENKQTFKLIFVELYFFEKGRTNGGSGRYLGVYEPIPKDILTR